MEVILKHKKIDYWSKVTKYKSCADTITSYWTRSGGKYTGLAKEDETRLEASLGFAEGTLAKTSPYWITFGIKLGEKPLVLHTENAWDELKYIFLKSHKNIAVGISDNKQTANYILIQKDAEAKEANTHNRAKIDAIVEFKKMTLEDMRKCLRLYGVKSDNISAELVEATLFDLIEKDPKRYFTKWVNNTKKNTDYIIEEALSKNILRKSRNIYYYGTEVIGHSAEDVVTHLDNPKNQDLKLTILAELENK
jgi:hypothetical protein